MDELEKNRLARILELEGMIRFNEFSYNIEFHDIFELFYSSFVFEKPSVSDIFQRGDDTNNVKTITRQSGDNLYH